MCPARFENIQITKIKRPNRTGTGDYTSRAVLFTDTLACIFGRDIRRRTRFLHRRRFIIRSFRRVSAYGTDKHAVETFLEGKRGNFVIKFDNPVSGFENSTYPVT